jgi:hypothetical protein
MKSGAPTRPSIQQLRSEFAEQALEGWLWPWLTCGLMASVFAHLKPRYAAEDYSPSGRWDEDGAWELVHEFIMTRGIEGGAIATALMRADTTTGVEKYLEAALHNYTISERRRDTATNVFKRLSDVLAADARLRRFTGIGVRAAYGLEEWSHESPDRLDEGMLRDALQFMPPDVKWTEYASGNRLSPGLASRDLARIAHALIAGSGALWTAEQIMEAIELVFDLHGGDPDRPTLGDRGLAHVAAMTPVLDRVIADELAAEALRDLSDQQRSILRLMIQEPALGTRAIADRLGLSKSQVNNEQHRITAAFSALPLTVAEEKEQVLSAAAVLVGAHLSYPSRAAGSP